MNRLGLALLLGFVAIVGAFWLLIEKGGGPMLRPAPIPPAPARPAQTAAGRLPIPVAGVQAAALTDTFTEDRGGGTRMHGAIDIMAPRGTPVLAAAAGTVEKLFDSQAGGHTIYERSADGATVYYYAHLDTYATGLGEGQRVSVGQQIATVGSTGDASPDAPHLHFEVKRMQPGEKWYRGTAIDPYPLLTGR